MKFNGSIHKDLLPEKWDLADRLPDSMTIANVKEAIENVRAAHLDIQQIQNALQSANASDASQQLVERNIWQEVFKGKIVDSEKSTSLSNSSNTPDIETIEHRAKLMDDAQNLYEKKALEYSGISGTHEVYRDNLEKMIKNFGESHRKVTLYKDIVRDVSILHSAQLGMNINDLPDSHHKEIAGTIYNNITSYKASNGRGQSEHNIDEHDKIKIAANCYEQLCGSKAWSNRALNSVKVADNALSSVNLSRQENAANLLKQEKQKIKNILKLNPKFDQEALKQTLAQVGASEQQEVLNTIWLGEFKAKVLPELDALQKEKVASQTVNELIGVFKKEKEYCSAVHDNYFSLNFALKLQEDNNHISSVVSDYRYKPNLLDNLTRDINASQQYGIWNEGRSLSYMKQCDSAYDSAQFMFQTCRDHVLKTIDNDLDTIKSKGVLEYDGQKYHDQIHYLEHRLNTNEGQTYVADSKASITLARLKEEQSYEMNSVQNNQNIAEKIEDVAPAFKIKL